MSSKHLSPETRLQIAIAAIRQTETVPEICTRFGIAESTYYRIRDEALEVLKKYLGRGPKHTREAQLEREVKQLKELVADYAAAVHILKKNPLRQ